jgi:hypothetical protein
MANPGELPGSYHLPDKSVGRRKGATVSGRWQPKQRSHQQKNFTIEAEDNQSAKALGRCKN